VGAVLVLVGIVLVQLEAPPASLPVPG
jgi:hypothetical protein